MAQFPLRGRIIRALERHPQVLDSLNGALMLGGALHRYAMRDDYRRLHDPALNRHIRNYRILFGIGASAWLVLFVAILVGGGRF